MVTLLDKKICLWYSSHPPLSLSYLCLIYVAIASNKLLKVHFVIHRLILPFFSPRKLRFSHQQTEAFRCVQSISGNSFVWPNSRPNCLFYYVEIEITTSVDYATLRYSKTFITHKRILWIDWKFGNKLILSICNDLSHRSSMLGSRNGHLKVIFTWSWW